MITIEEIQHDSSHELGIDPGLVKDGVEAHLQVLLADHVDTLGGGYTLVRREYPTPIGPVDLLCRATAAHGVSVDPAGDVANIHGIGDAERYVAVEIKRRANIDAVEQLTRYLELLNRDTSLAPVGGILAAQMIAPQARTLAEDRGIRCVVLDYNALRGMTVEGTLF